MADFLICKKCHKKIPFSEISEGTHFFRELKEWGPVERRVYICSGDGSWCGNEIPLFSKEIIIDEKILESR